MPAHVRAHNGAPTLFLDGKPVFDALMWGVPPAPDGYLLAECARQYAAAGVHFHTFDVGTVGASPEWCGPGAGRAGQHDFASLGGRLGRLLDADPEARFHLRIHLEMPPWWRSLHPGECELLSDGRRMAQSYASLSWRGQATEFLEALVARVRDEGLEDRVFAYQVGAGGTGEWVKGEGSMGSACGDYSAPMREQFGEWLRDTYAGDRAALRAAWAAPDADFDTAVVPPAERQLATTRGSFRDPRRERDVVDYFRCLANLCADLVRDFCATVKRAAGGRALAGAFYGYLMELSWNSGFFGEGVESPYSTYQRSGHLGLARVLESPDVDFLVSPYSYGFRGIGGHGPSMIPTGSARLHGKLVVVEDDTRTRLSTHDHPNYGKTEKTAHTVAVLKRNFACALCHGHGIWWLAASSPTSPHIDLAQEPAFRPLIARFQELGSWALRLDRAPQAQVAVLLDDESFLYESLHNDLDLPSIFQQRLWGLPRMGAPVDTYLLGDLLAGRLPPYKLYVFLNPFRLDASRRKALARELRREGRVALWIYAPGYLDEGPSLEAMQDLTGFQFAESPTPWGPLAHVTDFSHPITRGLPQELSWGTNSRLAPVFHLDDPEARILGHVVYSQGRCVPGLAVKGFAEWSSVYSAAPNLPAPLLRGIARYAGAHLYNEEGDVLYATRDLLAVHTTSGGRRVFRLPRRVETVTDLLEPREVARDTDRFEVQLEAASTALYFTGERALSPPLRG